MSNKYQRAGTAYGGAGATSEVRGITRSIGGKVISSNRPDTHVGDATNLEALTPTQQSTQNELAVGKNPLQTNPTQGQQPSPQTTQINPPSLGNSPTLQPTQAPQPIAPTPSPYKQGLANAQQSGVQAPATQGAANVQSYMPPPENPKTNPNVDNFFQINPYAQQSSKDLMDFLSPPGIQKQLFDQMKKVNKGQNQIAQEQLELMNKKRIMEGTPDNIRDEIQASGGLGTESQIQAMAISRNKTLLKEASFLQDQLQLHETSVNNDISLLNFEKEMANTQFSQRMNMEQLQQQNYQNSISATKDQFKTNLDLLGADGLYDAMSDSPQQIDYFERLHGLPPGGLAIAAHQAQQARQLMGVKGQSSSGGGGGGSSGGGVISSTTQAIINNPSLFDDLTPTEKGKVISQLQANGYDTSNIGVKGLSDAAIKEVSQTQKALSDLSSLKTLVQGNENKLGPLTGLQRFNPWSSTRKLQADVDRVRQTVGKALEGGVLRKEDEDKYKKILATLSDTPSTALYKIDALISSITRDIENYKSLQQSAGRSLNVGAGLQKSGQITRPEDLRNKYHY